MNPAVHTLELGTGDLIGVSFRAIGSSQLCVMLTKKTLQVNFCLYGSFVFFV